MKNIIITYLLFVVSSYLIVAFIKWELNPELWTQFGRGMYILYIICCIPVVYILQDLIEKNK